MKYETKNKIVLIRHGQTEWNVAGRRQGHGDSPLTSLGRQQAHAIGKSLYESRVLKLNTDIVCSPIGRAVATADLICRVASIPAREIELDSRLKEVDHGGWEGLTKDQIELKYPGEIEKRLANHWNYVFPNGESYQALSIRVKDWLSTISNRLTVVVVTHDMVSRVIRKEYLGLTQSECLSLHHNQSGYFILERGKCSRYEVSTNSNY